MSNKVIVSVDVEDWYHGPTVISPRDEQTTIGHFLSTRQGIERAAKYVDICLEMLAAHDMKATFFWVAEYAKRHEHLLRRVAEQGHEIGCHGLAHYSKLDCATKAPVFGVGEFAARTEMAKHMLEDMTGTEVIGYRAPNAYFSGKMFDALEELGFRYDSSVSVNSIYNKTDSALKGVGTAPYYPARGELKPGDAKRRMLEFPWPYFDVGVAKLPSAGGPFLRTFGSALTIAGLHQSLRRGHAVFYFHPIDICKEDIPLPFSPSRPMMWLFKGDMVRRRIERVLSEFRGVSANFREVVDADPA
ncbi:MAG: polysaccharide deacetylase family protein [Betaproteobacteria bacterium]|nr:polysaccharide deacetylase family protein [Betaproteobacteria bacterium]